MPARVSAGAMVVGDDTCDTWAGHSLHTGVFQGKTVSWSAVVHPFGAPLPAFVALPTIHAAMNEHAAAIDRPTIRQAGRDLLSLALMDARNHTLHLLSRFEEVPPRPDGPYAPGATADPFAIAGHVGWFAEAWTARNMQRAQGMACPQRPTRLASLHPHADAWWDGEAAVRDPAAADPQAVRGYLLETLEGTLELLAKAQESDDALYFYRLALFHEDLRGEQLVEIAQERGVALPLAGPHALTPRPPLVLPATRWTMGLSDGGFVVDNERLAHGVSLPECEMDAQPVAWAQYVEFVDDGGYDRQELWHPDGWAWLQAQAQDGAAPGGRAPRHVEQIGVASGSVMQRRFGQMRRMPGNQPVLHASCGRPTRGAAGPGAACPPRWSGSVPPAAWHGRPCAGAMCGSGPAPPSGRTRASSQAPGPRIPSRISATPRCCVAAPSPRGSA